MHGIFSTGRDGKSKNFTVFLVNTKDDPFAGCSSATLTMPSVPKHSFIHFNLTTEGFKILDVIIINGFSKHYKTSLDSQLAVRDLKSKMISRYAKTEILNQSPFPVGRNSSLFPEIFRQFSG